MSAESHDVPADVTPDAEESGREKSRKEAAAVAHPLNVHEYGPGIMILSEKLKVLVELDVGLVSYPNIIRKALAAFDTRLSDKRKGHVAALCQKGDVTPWRIPQTHQV